MTVLSGYGFEECGNAVVYPSNQAALALLANFGSSAPLVYRFAISATLIGVIIEALPAVPNCS
jgi:hypothetical protein